MEKLKQNQKEICIEAAFLFFVFCYYVMWARIQPLNASPDELMRYNIAQYIYEHHSIPRGDDPAVRDAVWGISYAFTPILSYMISAVFMMAMSLVTAKPAALLFAARMVSVLCGVGTVFFSLRIGKKMFEGRKAWLFTSFIAFLPGAVFITSYVNTDSMAMMSTAIIVYYWICGLEDGWSVKSCVGLSVGISFCALSYYNAYGFILCSILLFGSSLLLQAKEEGDYRIFLKRGALVTVLVLVMISWWFVRNYILYDGDLLGRTASGLCAEKYAAKGFKPSDKVTPQSSGMGFFEMLYSKYPPIEITWVELVSRSFVGRFGSLNIAMKPWMENNLMDFIKFGFLLSFLHPVRTFALKVKNKISLQGIFHWCMMIALIIPNFLNAYYSYSSDFQPQGRYSLPMLVPLTYFMVRGYENLFDGLIESEKVRKAVYTIFCLLLAGLSIYVYLTIFWPSYMAEPFSIGAFIRGNE